MSGNRNQSADKVLELELLSSTSELLKLGEEKRSVAGITIERRNNMLELVFLEISLKQSLRNYSFHLLFLKVN